MHFRKKLTIVATLLLLPAVAVAQTSNSPNTPAAPSNPVTADAPSAPVAADAPKQTPRQRVVFLLSGYEYFPTRADLDTVGSADEISEILRELATDVDGRPSQRLRAIDALGFYDDDATLKLLTDLVTKPPKQDLPRRRLRTAGLLRHHAITSLARATKDAAVPVLEPVLMGDDVQLALTAIHAIGKHCGKEGRSALNRLVRASDNKTVVREARKWVR